MPRLVLISAPDPIEYKLAGDTFTIGRLPQNDLILAGADVAPRHAEIRAAGGKRRIVALTGAGAKVNNLEVSDEQLASGDVIAIGDNQLLYDERDEPAAAPPRDWRRVPPDDTGPATLPQVEPDPELLPSPGEPDGSIVEIERLFNVEPVPSPEESDLGGLLAAGRPDRLRLLYQTAHVMASSPAIEDTLDLVLSMLFQATRADRGVIFIAGAKNELKPVRARNRRKGPIPDLQLIRAVVERAAAQRLAILCADSCYVPETDPATQPNPAPILSALCVPIIGEKRVAGAIYLDHLDETRVFSTDDADAVGAVAELLGLALERETMNLRLHETQLIQSALERFHSPDVARTILDQVLAEKGFDNLFREREASILFTDISGFTGLIERMPPRDAAMLLNRFYDEISAVVFKYKGTVDKFIGDAVMATFGAPISYGNDAELAVFAAIEIMRRMAAELQPAASSGRRFQVRIGVNTGIVISGYVGSRRRLDYTVLGDPVNVASRLTDLAQPGAILIGEDTYAKVRGLFSFKHRGATALRGKKSEINLYEVSY